MKETQSLLNFLDNSPSAWHAVENCKQDLIAHGFTEIKESDPWKISPNGRYFIVRNGSSLCAFIMPKQTPTSLHIAASHTDSPTYKLKPNAEFQKENMLMLGLEIYGGPLLTSWLNRDLGIAGRAIFRNKQGELQEELVRIDDVPIVIPQLAIHLDRNVNENGLVLNKQEHLAAIATLLPNEKKKNTKDEDKEKNQYLKRILQKRFPKLELLSFDLVVYPLEPARLLGDNGQLIASYRIDSLSCVHAALQAFVKTSKPSTNTIRMIAFWDHEEIGSHTSQGAGSPFFPHILERITLALKMPREDYLRMIGKSLCVSVDLGHAQHPNYADKHEPRHQALLNHGVLLKSNAQYKYASDALSLAKMIDLCQQNKIPYQKYVSRGDIPSGSTIGPIHAHLTGMPTVDIGCPQLSMHSARELMGTQDHLSLMYLLQHFFAA